MQSQTFEVLTCGAAAGFSRRRSLLTLGAAALTARLSHLEVGAAKRNKKRTDCKKKEQQRCSQDTALCKALVTPCLIQPEVCAAMQACCDACSASGVISCLQAIQN